MKKSITSISSCRFLHISILLLTITLCLPNVNAQTSKVDHSVFDKLLKKYVTVKGEVDYQNFANDRKSLRQYLNSLSNNEPDTLTWSREDQLAYWINLYNAFTTEIILDHYPLESIRDIGTKIPIVFGESAWDIEFINIASKTFTLDAIEHEVLKKYGDPRIHFALVCAATSCPNLRREAYLPEKLESQLNSQAILFLSDPVKNKIGSDVIKVSKVFDWYSDEFTKNGSIIDYINQYSRQTINPGATIKYFKFDWSLNGLK